MKAVRFHEHGGREVLRLEDVRDPAPGPAEVLVRVRACGVNHFDVDLRENVSRWRLALSHTLGIEFAGEVEAVGSGVQGVAAGDRVWVLDEIPCGRCEFCLDGADNVCLQPVMHGVQRPGGYAELVVAPARAVFPLPAGMTAEAAAAAQVSFTTAWHMLVTRGRVRAGETVLVSAAGSGVGHAAVQVAKLAGARVIASAGTDEKLARARADGADKLVNYRREDLTGRALELTGGRGVDLVIEHVGGELFGACLRSLRRGGRLVTCGAHAGEVVPFDIVPAFRMEWQVLGSRTGTTRETQTVFALVAAGRLVPRVHAALPLAEAAEAHRILESREQYGRVVLVP